MVICASGAAWAIWLMAAPVWPLPLSAAAYAVGAKVCHQIAARSFHLAGAQMAICARCAGIYAGTAVGLASLAWLGEGRAVRACSSRNVVLIGAVPVCLSVAIEWGAGAVVGNWMRFASGVVAGGAVATVVARAALR